MDYSRILKFKGTWRKYQARVLENSGRYLADGKIHIVAAPGSGKTTLGIELIGRIGAPALVLTPSITIREQWIDRIASGFLCEGLKPEDYLSQDLKDPRAITVVTYQALHSAMNRYSGLLKETEEKESDEQSKGESVDYSQFDLIQTMKENHIGTLCLDECHHLRSEWWKALEEFKDKLGTAKVIALTATPPYDSTPAMWKRYMDMCGDIDEEISIPELVKEGSLCPHQDFVYFNYPTEEEMKEVQAFSMRSQAKQKELMQDEEFAAAVSTHGGLTGRISDDELLENPDGLSALLIFLQAKNVPFPERLKRLLGQKRLPEINAHWMEVLLQGFCYGDTASYECTEEYREKIIAGLKESGLVEKKRVMLTANPAIEKLLTNSKGKCNSIGEIVKHEYTTAGKELRMLILTDYIRKECEKLLGDCNKDLNMLGVLPFFEQLRRAHSGKDDLRLGVLCGTIVIIPAEAKEALLAAVGDSGIIRFKQAGNLSEEDYVKVEAQGDAHFLTSAVTEVFTKGYMQVLIGTKSLLGEGWDSPCINSLILASFVGSFMLSNQMRGRAIRVFKDKPEKTSNIWHLVCLPANARQDEFGEISEDFTLLSRRMEHFLGLHYTENIIASGMNRLSIISEPYTKEHVAEMNRQMLELSGQRASLKERWMKSLMAYKNMTIVEETEIETNSIPQNVFKESLKEVLVGALGLIPLVLATAICSGFLGVLAKIALAADGLFLLSKTPKLIRLSTAEKRLKLIGEGIYKAMLRQGLLEDASGKVAVASKGMTRQSIALASKSQRDTESFSQCVKEFFGVVENQRYLLVRSGNFKGEDGFYCVPEVFGKKKEEAEAFYQNIRPYIGDYELVYTRNETGRKVLLEAKVKALANKKARCSSYKKVADRN